jgi:hypothetical protein
MSMLPHGLVALALALLVPELTLAQAPAPSARLERPLRLADSFSMPVSDGCVYNATVRGTVTPASPKGGDERVNPNLSVTATLTCPNKPVVKVSDTVNRTGPLSLDEVEAAIERRASISAGGACLFTPELELSPEGLTGIAVKYLCPVQP